MSQGGRPAYADRNRDRLRRRRSGPRRTGRLQGSRGLQLTYLPFISRAVIDALREYPHLNASVGDGNSSFTSYVNLAVAVDLDFQGLLGSGGQGRRRQAHAGHRP